MILVFFRKISRDNEPKILDEYKTTALTNCHFLSHDKVIQ